MFYKRVKMIILPCCHNSFCLFRYVNPFCAKFLKLLPVVVMLSADGNITTENTAVAN